MIRKIFKCILAYTLFYLIDMLIFSALLFRYRIDIDMNYKEFLYCQFLKSSTIVNSSVHTMLISFFQNIIEVSAIAILTSYMFTYILNRSPRIVFPDKLVIRHRTSWESRNKITLGVLIGNKNIYDIHNVLCSITCSYIKQENPLLINSEFTLKDERILLENFYRFSFDLTKFPKQILQDIIEKPSYYDKDTIVVSISGNSNYIGNSFKLSRKYRLSDIVYDEHTPIIAHSKKNKITGKDLINPFTKKIIKKID